MNNTVESLTPNVQAGLCLLTRHIFKNFAGIPTTDELFKKLDVTSSSAYNAKKLIEGILSIEQYDVGDDKSHCALLFERDILRFEVEHPASRTRGERNCFTLEYKNIVIQKKEEYHLDWGTVGKILSISEDTLKKFTRGTVKEDNGIRELTPELVNVINVYLRQKSKLKSVKGFYEGHSDIIDNAGLTYRSLCKLLLDLGFTNVNGIFKTGIVLDRLLRFKPGMIWGTDGKVIIVEINGKRYKWVWQCLIDYTTTVIVGGLVNETENTANLFESLKIAKDKWQTTPLAIVLDNRLSENLPVIKDYLDTCGIEIIKTFPGNPKSNGITEGNFSIFEIYMGGIVSITGNTNEELSKSVAKMIVEIFTQLRNHKRRGENPNTPVESLDKSIKNDIPEEEVNAIKEKLKLLANRLKVEQQQPVVQEQKRAAIEQALQTINPPSVDAFTKGLSANRITVDMILQALAIFKTKKEKNPENNYGHHYFGGIINNLSNSEYLTTLHVNLGWAYYENLEILKKIRTEEVFKNLNYSPEVELTRLAKCFIEMPLPALKANLLIVIKECFLIATKGVGRLACELNNKIVDKVIKMFGHGREMQELLIRKIHEWSNEVKLYEAFSFSSPATEERV